MTSHLMIPDTQVRPNVKLDHLHWANSFIKDKKPDKIILIGDWWDMPSLSYWTSKQEAEGMRYREDIECGMDALSILMKGVKSNVYFTEGNHEKRICRYVEQFPVHEGSMSIKDCNVEKFGIKRIPFLKPICLDGVYYSHYFHPPHNNKNAHPSARALLQREHHSCSMGHVQTLDTAVQTKANGKYIRGLIAGSFYLHDEEYRKPMGNNHWRGMIFKENVRAGMYDLHELSVHSLKRDYG